MEEWRPVRDYEDRYEVSNLGRVRSLICGAGVRTKPRIQTCRPERDGYVRARLWSAGRSKAEKRMVHRMVLEAFMGVAPVNECDHINGVRHDNRLENLRWVSHQQNIDHRDTLDHTAWGERGGNAKLTEEQVQEIRATYRPRVVSQRILAERYGVCQATIAHIVTGRNWARLEAA